ncbi:MAG: hypothetical protein ACK4X1_03655 [Terricaulis sp.]
MRTLLLTFALFIASCASPAVAQQQPAHTMPDWWVAHVDFMSRGGGTWVAPNPGNAADPAQPDAFGMEWRAANNGHVLIGRLYGIEAGEETSEFWSFREFWHPGEQRAVLEQWGGPGLYGVGTTTMEGNRGTVEQIFWLPDGRDWKEGHRTVEDGDTYITDQFDIDANGVWTPNGSYTWRRIMQAQ